MILFAIAATLKQRARSGCRIQHAGRCARSTWPG